MRKLAIAVFLCLTITGCSTLSESRTELLENPHGQHEFQVERNYQTVYRNIKDGLQDYKSSSVGFSIDVDAELYTDLKQAVISLDMIASLFASTHLYVEIDHLTQDATKVKVCYRRGEDELAGKVVKWAKMQ